MNRLLTGHSLSIVSRIASYAGTLQGCPIPTRSAAFPAATPAALGSSQPSSNKVRAAIRLAVCPAAPAQPLTAGRNCCCAGQAKRPYQPDSGSHSSPRTCQYGLIHTSHTDVTQENGLNLWRKRAWDLQSADGNYCLTHRAHQAQERLPRSSPWCPHS